MAWTAPSATDYAVGEIVTAAKMNSNIANNLRYLKGTDGAITLDNILGLRGTPTYTLDVLGADVAASGLRVRADGFTNVPVPGAISDATVINARGFNMTTDGILVSSGYRPGLGIGAAANRATPLIALNNTGGPSLLVEAGSVGIGTSAPATKFNVFGAGGGVLFISEANVDGTLRTPVAAATVTKSAFFYLSDHNDTTGTGVGALNGTQVAVGGNTTYANTDTITVAVTAGGAITLQRTVGTNGTHDIRGWVIYQ